MDKKTFTVLVTTNRKGATRSLSLSAAWVKAGAIVGGFLVLVLLAGFVDYMSLLIQSNENKRLKADNQSLRKQFEVVESKVNSLETSLERVKNFSTKLKLITDVDDEDRSTKLAMGQYPKPGQSMDPDGPMDIPGERQPSSSEFMVKDSEFLNKAPLENSGELARVSNQNYSTLSIRIDRAVKQTHMREQGILELWETLSERQSILSATPSIKPARGWFSSRFGYRLDPVTGRPAMHGGLDIAAPPGTPVVAPADGVVSYTGYEAGYGKIISIDHGYGVKTRYAHNSQLFVETGQKIKRHDVIAAIGSTGKSTGPHLHYEIRVHGVPVDPMNYILEQ